MLFERWDKRRDIKLPSPIQKIQSQIKFTIMYLANWIYSDQSLQGGVIEKKLITKASEYLLKRRFDDPDEAEEAAGEFVRFCRGRAWVFTDVGTNKDGDSLYKFTHRTFLEYFTACSLVRNSRSVEALFNTLLPKIANQEWDMVCQLAFKLQDKKTEDGGDELLNSLVNQIKIAENDLEKQGNLLDFAVRCLEFIVPNPRVTKKITKATIDYCITWGCLEKLNKGEYATPTKLLDNLSQSDYENISSILDQSELVIINYINKGSDLEKTLGLEIFDYFDHKKLFNIKDIIEIETLCKENIIHLSQKTLLPQTLRYLLNETISINDLIKWHGVEALLEKYEFKLFFFYEYYPIIFSLVSEFIYISGDNSNYLEARKFFLKSLVRHLRSYPQPIFKNVETRHLLSLVDSLFSAYNWGNEKSLYFDVIFEISLLIMMLVELLTFKRNGLFDNELFDALSPFRKLTDGYGRPDIFNHILYTFLARYNSQYIDKVQDELDNCKFTQEQQTLIWQWVRKEIDFVEKTEESENSDFEEN